MEKNSNEKYRNNDSKCAVLQAEKKENIIPLCCSECGLPIGFINRSHSGDYNSFRCRACALDLGMLCEIIDIHIYPWRKELITMLDNTGCKLHDYQVSIAQRIGHSLVRAWYWQQKRSRNEN